MKYLLQAVFLLLTLPGFSQGFDKKTRNMRIQTDLSSVVRAYFGDFASELGDTIFISKTARVYTSKISIPGAQSTIIKKYFSPLSYSWEAVMPETESFEEAAQQYNQYYRQISGIRIMPAAFEKARLIGNYDSPVEGKSFAASTFRLENPSADRRNFMIQLDLQYEFPYWRSKISMFEKVPDNEIRPTQQRVR